LPRVNQQELQNLRHLIGDQDLWSRKFQTFSGQCQDAQLKNLLQQMSQNADSARQSLLNHLQ